MKFNEIPIGTIFKSKSSIDTNERYKKISNTHAIVVNKDGKTASSNKYDMLYLGLMYAEYTILTVVSYVHKGLNRYKYEDES